MCVCVCVCVCVSVCVVLKVNKIDLVPNVCMLKQPCSVSWRGLSLCMLLFLPSLFGVGECVHTVRA